MRRAHGRAEVLELLREVWSPVRPVRIPAAVPEPRARLMHVLAGRVRLYRLRLDGSAEVVLEPRAQVWVGCIHRGSLSHSETPNKFAAGEVLLGHCPDRPWQMRLQDTVLDVAVFASEVITRGLAIDPAGDPNAPPVRGPVSARAAHRWWRTFAYANELLSADPSCSPDICGGLERLLSEVTRDTFPHPCGPRTTDVDPEQDRQLATLRRAIAVIEADPAAEITLTDLAQAARVSPRSVQLAFRRHLDTTPTAHLRRVRLHRAHQDLCGDEPGKTVAAVARRWGFTTPGRFAAAYRTVYGHPPSRTLQELNPSTPPR